MPRSVMVAPPSLATVPPKVAPVEVMLALVGVVSVGDSVLVVNVATGEV